MKTKVIITLILLWLGVVPFQGHTQKPTLRVFTLDQSIFSCGDADVLIVLFFSSDSVKGIQQTFGAEGNEICAEPSGCYLGKVSQQSITGSFLPDYFNNVFKSPLTFKLTLNNNMLDVSKNNGTKYSFIEADTQGWMYTTSSINLREKPSSNSKILTKIPKDQTVYLLEFGFYRTIGDKKGFWTKVKFGDQEGWVFGSYLMHTDSNTGEEGVGN